jgi:hypothetical protein
MSKKKKPQKGLPLVNFKAAPSVKKAMKERARQNGMTLSEWVRFASTTFRPTKAQIQRYAA